MSKFVRIVELFLLLLLALSTIGFLTFANLYGLFLALVTAVIAIGVFRRARWGYFACAAWGLACYQLAKQGYEFADLKRYAMVLGFLVVIVAIFLHEKLGKKSVQPTSTERDEG
jgi:hypothetical protein